jgi:hypothetical protein
LEGLFFNFHPGKERIPGEHHRARGAASLASCSRSPRSRVRSRARAASLAFSKRPVLTLFGHEAAKPVGSIDVSRRHALGLSRRKSLLLYRMIGKA